MYTLKNIRYSATLSEETHAYTADLCGPDGKIIGFCRNDGHGGETLVRGIGADGPALTAARAWAKALPPMPNPWGPEPFPMSLATWCDQQVTEFLNKRDFRKALRSRALVLVDGRVRQYHYTGQRTVTPELLADMRAKFPGAPILNEMPEADALALWLADSQDVK